MGSAGCHLWLLPLTATGGALRLPLIKNKKTVNPRDSGTEPVFQLVRLVVCLLRML